MDKKELTGLERLEEALRRYDEIYLQKYPPLKNRIYDQPNKRKSPHMTLRKGIAAILAAILILFTGIMSVSAARESASRLLVRIREAFTELFSNQHGSTDISGKIEAVYTLSHLPEGFTPYQSNVGDYEVKRLWRHDNGDLVIFTQLPLNARSTLDNENISTEVVYIGKTKILYTEKNGICCYYWNTDEYLFSLNVSTAIAKKDAITMIKSVSKV